MGFTVRYVYLIFDIVYHEKFIKLNFNHMMEKYSFHKYIWAVYFFFFGRGEGVGQITAPSTCDCK